MVPILLSMKRESEALGRRVRRLRVELKWTQEELARATGIDQTAISKLENRAGYEPSVFIAARVAQALGVTTDELVLADDRAMLPKTVPATPPGRSLPPELEELVNQRVDARLAAEREMVLEQLAGLQKRVEAIAHTDVQDESKPRPKKRKGQRSA